ncbi:MAG: NAD(P)/FAD-dependent oxidoreductase [Actinomycetota bacterium]
MGSVAVAGAGLTGCLLAVRLARAGHEVSLYDRRPDLRVRDVDAGRSINLAVSTRGLDALSRIGLDEIVLEQSIPLPGRMIHDLDGSTTFQPYGTEPDHRLHSVGRDALNIALLDAVDATPRVTTYFEHRVRDLSVRRRQMVVEHEGRRHEREFDTVYGADGAYSAVRGRLQRIGRVDFSQTFLDHGYKELTIPPASDGGFAMDPNALHIWPRGGHMMIALPNTDHTFTGTLFWSFEGRPGFETVASPGDIRSVFDEHFPDARDLIPDLEEQYADNPASSLVTMRTWPWHHDGDVVIVGDAAHAVVPFLGQGANAALEDVTILMDLYERHGDDNHSVVFEQFSTSRKPHADALADLAIEHYEEMRSDVSSRVFLVGKWLERILARVFPSRFVPLYTMVSFTRTPYADAVQRARRQQEMAWGVAVAVLVVVTAVVLLSLL